VHDRQGPGQKRAGDDHDPHAWSHSRPGTSRTLAIGVDGKVVVGPAPTLCGGLVGPERGFGVHRPLLIRLSRRRRRDVGHEARRRDGGPALVRPQRGLAWCCGVIGGHRGPRARSHGIRPRWSRPVPRSESAQQQRHRFAAASGGVSVVVGGWRGTPVARGLAAAGAVWARLGHCGDIGAVEMALERHRAWERLGLPVPEHRGGVRAP